MKELAKGRPGRISMLMMGLVFSLAASSGIVNAADKAEADRVGASTSVSAGARAGNRNEIAKQILDRWQPIAVELGENPVTWREIFSTQFGLLDASILNSIAAVSADGGKATASYARFTQAIRNAGMQAYANAQSGKGQTKLGSPTSDFVYIPLVPCRLVDTRNVGGPLGAFATRNFYFFTDTGTLDYGTIQGGAPGMSGTVCPGTYFADDAPLFSAAMVTVTVVSPSVGPGNLVMWGGASPVPTASALNWQFAGEVIANTTAVPAGGRSGSGPGGLILDFAVKNNTPGTAQVVVDVVGYFVENVATALQCVYLAVDGTAATIANGSGFSISHPACTTGYTLTGAGCYRNGGGARIPITEASTDKFKDCEFLNNSGATVSPASYGAESVCCRVPGR